MFEDLIDEGAKMLVANDTHLDSAVLAVQPAFETNRSPVEPEPEPESESEQEQEQEPEYEFVCDRCRCGCDDITTVRIYHRGSEEWCEECVECHTQECEDCGVVYRSSDGDGEHCERCSDNYVTCDRCEDRALTDNTFSVRVSENHTDCWCESCCDNYANTPDDDYDDATYWSGEYCPSRFLKREYHSHHMRDHVMCRGKSTPHVGFEFEVRGDFDEQARLLAKAGFTQYDLMPENDGSLNSGDTEWVSRPVPREEAASWAMKFVETVSEDDEFANNGCGCHFNIYCSEYGVEDRSGFATGLAIAISVNRTALELFSHNRDLGCYAADRSTPGHHAAVQMHGDRVEIRLCAMTETPEWMGLQVRTYLEIIDWVIAHQNLSNLNMFKYLTPELRELWESTMPGNEELWEGIEWVDPAQLAMEFKEPVSPFDDRTGLKFKAGDSVVITEPGQVYSSYAELAQRMGLHQTWARGRETESLGDLASARIVCKVGGSDWHSLECREEVLAVRDPRDNRAFLINVRGVRRAGSEASIVVDA